ncbi:MAG TPA: class I SAM-dependent methyltransferase [Longimicrobium sp.]|uniref:class I SAM-dependent methyltransferase n=1 Tax=Longimicrobium sp. TaxID=2029185 RepID=UPI002ED86D23
MTDTTVQPSGATPRTAPVGACPLCDGTEAPVLFAAPDRLHETPGEFTYRRCAACRTVYQDPRVVGEDLPLCYPGEYGTHVTPPPVSADGATRAGLRELRGAVQAAVQGRPAAGGLGWAGRLLAGNRAVRERAFGGLRDELLPRRPGTPRALDVGCGAGELLARLRLAGYDAQGVEWDPAAAEVGRRTSGCPVQTGDFRAVDLPAGSFDLVVLSHVFEHLDDPRGALRRIHELLAPGGRAVLLYPNPESLGARVFGSAWFNWDPPRHLVIPPGRALAAAARRAGLAVVRLSSAAPNVVSDFRHSRAVRAGLTGERLRRPPRAVWDAVGARAEGALRSAGMLAGEEVVLVLQREG